MMGQVPHYEYPLLAVRVAELSGDTVRLTVQRQTNGQWRELQIDVRLDQRR